VTFDRPIDPRTFTGDDVTLIFRNPSLSADQPGVQIPFNQIKVTPLDIGQLFGTRRVGNTVLLSSSTQTFNSTNVPLGIPDLGKVLSTLTINPALLSSDQIINDLNITVTLNHPNVSSLKLTLVSPRGTRVALSNQTGTGADFSGTTFDDEAA